MSCYKQPLRLCVRNIILRSTNAKYHYSYLFFYKMNKGDLNLGCIPVFFGVNSMIKLFFFGCYCLTPVTLFIIGSKGSTEKQPGVGTLSTQKQFTARKTIESQIFLTTANFHHRCTAVNV